MQREANLIATIRAKLLDFTRMCADDSELVMLQDAFAADYKKTSTCCLGWTVAAAPYDERLRLPDRGRRTNT